MRYLGIDFGTKRIGLSLSDEEGMFAFPHAIIPHDHMLYITIASVITNEQVKEVVVGKSVATNDAPNDISGVIESFVHTLKQHITIPVAYEREGFSSVEAHRYQEKKGHRDDSAAAIILQRYLDKKKK